LVAILEPKEISYERLRGRRIYTPVTGKMVKDAVIAAWEKNPQRLPPVPLMVDIVVRFVHHPGHYSKITKRINKRGRSVPPGPKSSLGSIATGVIRALSRRAIYHGHVVDIRIRKQYATPRQPPIVEIFAVPANHEYTGNMMIPQ
jgi:hypothetical protein